MNSIILISALVYSLGFFHEIQAAPTAIALRDSEQSTEVALTETTTTAIDTLSESEGGLRVKRSGCGCCCCRPCCCCCCRPCCCCRCCRCCTCCRTCCCTCCRPCCCGCGGCGCCGCGGCGCCGCGGGRKRRALQALKIKHFEKVAREQKAIEAASNEEQQQAQGEYQEGPQEQSQIADNQEQQSVEKLSESEEAKPNYMRTATIVGPIAQTATGFVVNVPQQPNVYGYY